MLLSQCRLPHSEEQGHIGTTHDLDTVAAALEGVYGAYVNTDSFTIGEQKETFCGIRIFELAKQVKTVRHYVWSGADNVNKVCGSVFAPIQLSLTRGLSRRPTTILSTLPRTTPARPAWATGCAPSRLSSAATTCPGPS